MTSEGLYIKSLGQKCLGLCKQVTGLILIIRKWEGWHFSEALIAGLTVPAGIVLLLALMVVQNHEVGKDIEMKDLLSLNPSRQV